MKTIKFSNAYVFRQIEHNHPATFGVEGKLFDQREILLGYLHIDGVDYSIGGSVNFDSISDKNLEIIKNELLDFYY